MNLESGGNKYSLSSLKMLNLWSNTAFVFDFNVFILKTIPPLKSRLGSDVKCFAKDIVAVVEPYDGKNIWSPSFNKHLLPSMNLAFLHPLVQFQYINLKM